jgi:cell division protein FtsB
MATGAARTPTRRQARRIPRVEVPVTLPADSAPQRWLTNIRFSTFTIMMLVLIVLAVIVLAPSLKLLIEQNAQIAGLERSVARQKTHVTSLDGQVARWSDPAYIEAQARNRLLFVFPGEYSYLVIPDSSTAAATDASPISTHIQHTQVDWVASITASLLNAGLSTATKSQLVSPSGSVDSPVGSPAHTPAPSTSGSGGTK